MTEGIALNGLTLGECERLVCAHGLSAHQAKLTFQAIHRHGVLDPEKMPAISDKCRTFLRTLPPFPRLALDAVHRADDGTIKLRLKTRDGLMIESVIIPAETPPYPPLERRGGRQRRTTLCVSSQVGCAAACAFCHTGTLGLKRNLAPWEIVEQCRIAGEVLCDRAQSKIENRKSKITNVVFMGMGEPLHNMDNVVEACRILGEGVGAGLSRRRIVVSTVGVGNKLRQFWETGVASLAISLHATTDELRGQLVPVGRQWNLATLRQILLDIPWRSRESVTIAYLLLDDVNDTHADAQRLAKWLAGMPAKLNLLEFNPYPGARYRRAGPEKLAAFRQWLYELGVFNTLRHSRGGDVLAACGQLAGRVSCSPP